jgi:murein endopeptidase
VRRLAVLLAAALLAAPAAADAMQIEPAAPAAPVVDPPIEWRDSRAVGKPFAGRLVDGVQLPEACRDFGTYDWGLRTSPNRPWRRWGTDRLVQTLLDVLGEYRAANPQAPRVGIADLSRPHGGRFGRNFGGLGHASHQNGLDVDVYYPRLDGLERRAYKPSQVDLELAQDLLDRFVAAGARTIYVGPSLGLKGPRKVVEPLAHHDDHMHVRLELRPPPSQG